jgi:hypothetical protein
MELTANDVAQIPPGTLRVPRDQFVALWTAAEHRLETVNDWYAAGVAMTCRWIAGVTVPREDGSAFLAYAPVTKRRACAYEELIQAECVEAEALAIRRPGWVARRDGWIDAVVGTLNWAWMRTAPPPLPLGDQATA